MTTNSPKRPIPKADRSVMEWLLDSDPSIRWQVMRDLTDTSDEEVAIERAKVATDGWGAQLLAVQDTDGSWSGTAFNQGWDSTMHILTLLREFGLNPASDQARRAMGLVRDHVRWMGWDWDGTWRGRDFVGNLFFAGEVEPCINGQVMASGAYFGQDCQWILDRLLNEQLSDGGWNCEVENGSTRSSFNTTICVLEAMLEYQLAGGRDIAITDARLRGQEYLRRAGVTPDERVTEAIDLVLSKRDGNGRWLLEVRYPGRMPVDLDEVEGRPSRWNTLRALRVLDWYSA